MGAKVKDFSYETTPRDTFKMYSLSFREAERNKHCFETAMHQRGHGSDIGNKSGTMYFFSLAPSTQDRIAYSVSVRNLVRERTFFSISIVVTFMKIQPWIDKVRILCRMNTPLPAS